jgi:hypothetical protein
MVLECLVSVFEESQLIVAISDGCVEGVNTDIMTLLLKFTLSIVTSIDVSSLSLDLDVLVFGVTAVATDLVELVFVSSVDFRFVGNLKLEADGLVVSSLDRLLGCEIEVDNMVLPFNAFVKSFLSVSDLEVDVVSMVSPDNGMFVNTNLESFNPGSQKLEESLPIGVIGHGDKKRKFVHNILVNSEIGRNLLVDIFKVLGLGVDSLAEVTSRLTRNINIEVGVILSIVVAVTFRHNSFVLQHL